MADPTVLTDLSAVKLALMAKMARAQTESLLRADPIAIVGMACRVPGGGDTPEKFWEILRDARDTVSEVPADRWDAEAWFDADPAAPSRSITKSGAFLGRIDEFDADYFGILPREAERMDPQQRLLLEVAVEALADAGLPDVELRGTRSGVFIASYHSDYAQLQYDDLEAVDARTLTGTLHSVLANRLSFLLDLRGPSVSIDTACSSSLVAVHLACQSLRFGETDVAIAGGVSLMVTPDLFVSMSKIGFMAPDGRCKTFDARADGFGRGEGCGVVVLKRLSDAIAAGDRVLALVRGSAVNQDGHSTVLAAPNGLAQEAMIREALVNAQLSAGRIGFVEAHGTGTALGDPIEVEALAATVGRVDAGPGTCYIGTAKASIGHLEAASGVAGLIKTVLALRHHAIPPQAHFHKLSPHISLAGTRLAVPTELVPWPAGPVPRCAGVSSFGVGGTNAHIVLEEAPTLPGAGDGSEREVARLLPLSARSPEALRETAAVWTRFLEDTPDSMANVCFTAAERRSHHDCRLAIVGRSREELLAGLEEFVRDGTGPRSAAGRRGAAAPRIAFVFSGQGPQWYGMGRELLASEPVFRSVITECDALLRPLSGWSLLEELAAPEERSRLDQTEIAQPALFALQAGLAALWRSWDVVPAGVVGHSVGEIAALHTAGVLTLPDAVRVVWNRARIMQQATGLGRMASVGFSAAEAAAAIAPYGERVSVGAINGPRTTVLSGEAGALEELLASLAARGIDSKMLPVLYAFHSAQMTPFDEQLTSALSGLRWDPPTTAVYSTVTGGLAAHERFDASYFGRSVRQPVLFASAIEAMGRDGFDVFAEIGPHPVLAAAIADGLAESQPGVRVLSSLRRGVPERDAMLRALSGLYVAGCDPSWAAVDESGGQVVSLPSYPWQRRRHWIRARPDRFTTRGKPSELSTSSGADESLYEVRWEERDGVAVPSRADAAAGSWIIFADRSGTANALIAELAAKGGRCVSVRAATALRHVTADSWTVDPAEPRHFDAVMASAGAPVRGVVHLWNLDVPALGTSDPDTAASEDLLGSGSVLHLAQTLARGPADARGPFWVVTSGAEAAGDDAALTVPRAAGARGLAGVVALEHPELSCRTVDLDRDHRSVQQLLADLLEPTGENRLAVRRGRTRVPRVAKYLPERSAFPARQASEPAPLADASATYLITGGAGALGLLTARWLAGSGAAHIALVGRRAPDTAAAAAIQALEAEGATVRFFAADVADYARMHDVLREIRGTLPPLRGIVHAAGVVDDGILLQQTWSRCLSALRGKAHGAFVLHALTLDDPLDFFVCYSSAVPLLGAPGQGSYAAANAELDALASARRGIGLPALSVAWGPWADGGMAAEASRRGHDAWSARGLERTDAHFGFSGLEALLRGGAVYAAVLRVDWTRFLQTLPASSSGSLFQHVAPAVAASTNPAPPAASAAFVARLTALPVAARRPALVQHLRERALDVIGLPRDTSVDPRVPFKELGLDSLMAVELRNTIARSVGRPLAATLLFDYPTLESLAAYFSRELCLDAAAESGEAPSSASAARITALSDDEAEAELLMELDRSAPRGRS